MNLYKRGNIWWLEYVSGGIRHRRSCHTPNKKVAQAFADSIKVAKKMPTFEDAVEVLRMFYNKPRKGVLPLDGAWEIYQEVAKSVGRDQLARSTIRMRASHFRAFLEWAKVEAATVTTVEGVTPPIAAAFAAHLQRGGNKAKTRKNIIGNLSTIWRMLEKASGEIRNPWANLAPTNDDGKRGKAFTSEQVEAVLEAARKVGKDWEPVVVIALHTGLRYGDVAMLTWQQIDGDILRVTPRKTQRHGISTAFPIIAPIRAALDALPRRGDFLFPGHAELYERAMSSHGLAMQFSEVLRAAGLDGQGFTFHSLRHTAATRLAGAGVGIETRKRILGHTEDATAERYDHDEHLGELKAAMEAAAK